MAKFVPDIKTQRWVVIAPGRTARPSQVRETEKPEQVVKKGKYNFRSDCPFCLGNEQMTPPEAWRVTSGKLEKDWLVRVVPNKYPITDTHEVIIHSPDHKLDIAEFPLTQVENILKAYRQRYQVLCSGGQVLIFNNKGLASGESLMHPHSQIVVIPKQIKLDVLPLEPIRNIVWENEFFTAYCPDFSQWALEVWLAPKKKEEFGEITDSELTNLAINLQKTIKKLTVLFPNLSYNFYIAPGQNWYLRIIPRLAERAGFELGTGLSVNSVDPSVAAEELKELG